MRCAVVGAGAWGTALADLLARNKHEVRLWAYEPDVVDSINRSHENVRFLRGHPLTESIRALRDVAATTNGADLVLFATPSHVLRSIVKGIAPALSASAPLVVATGVRSMRSWRGVFARRWLHLSLIPRSLVPALIALATVAGSIRGLCRYSGLEAVVARVVALAVRRRGRARHFWRLVAVVAALSRPVRFPERDSRFPARS